MLLDGQPQPQLVETPVTPDVALTVSEVPEPGYRLRDIVCTDRDTGAQLSTGGTVTPAVGQRVTCAVTNDDIAPTVTVHKIVVNNSGGTAVAGDFQLTLNGAPIAQGVTSSNLLANTPSVISEDNSVAGYAPTGVVCTSDVATSLNNKTATGTGTIEITPALAENIDCTITNDDVAVDLPTITLVKTVSNLWGGGLTPPDFQLKIDGVDAAQGAPHDVSVGAHTISETARPGYAQTGVTCVDLVTNATVGTAGSVNLVAGQDVRCTVANADQPAVLTLTKIVNNDDGGNAATGRLPAADRRCRRPPGRNRTTVGQVSTPSPRYRSPTIAWSPSTAPTTTPNSR